MSSGSDRVTRVTARRIANRRGNLPAMIEEHQGFTNSSANDNTTSSNETGVSFDTVLREPVAEHSTSSQVGLEESNRATPFVS